MKNTCVLFLKPHSYGVFEKVFDGKSAFQRSLSFAGKTCDKDVFLLASDVDAEKINQEKGFCAEFKPSWTNIQVLEKMKAVLDETGSDNLILAYSDCPFYNKELTKELTETHVDYKCEYTYADGYPAGFVPEIVNGGTVRILCELLKTSASSLANNAFTKDSLFDIIKTDINSFEVECIISDFDFRMWRYDFSCSTKQNFMACKALYEKNACIENLSSPELHELLKDACSDPKILKTVPAYYNLQLCAKEESSPIYSPYHILTKEKWGCAPSECYAVMDTEKAFDLIDEMEKVSCEAVVNLSMWGECVNHPDFLKIVEKILSKPGLSVFIETNGLLWTDCLIAELKETCDKAEERTSGLPKIMISVWLDAFTPEMYTKMRGVGGYETAVATLKKLCSVFADNVFPQYVRMNDNESELESFFRYWSNKENESGGNLIVQKYDNFAGLLPDAKPADLSPVERNVCWHLRRDMNILLDGSVPLCRTFLSESIGNVFEEGIESVWAKYDDELSRHIDGKPCDKCGKCDEFYTYNF